MIDSILLLVALFLPAIVYAFIIWATLPFKATSGRAVVSFFLLGSMSTVIIKLFWAIFPGWFGEWDIGLFPKMEDYYWTSCFLKVALPEEIAKYLAFFIIFKTYFHKRNIPGVAIMFYMGLVGLSFGIIENSGYIGMYGKGIVIVRTITSLILHMVVGLGMGYFIGLSRYDSLDKVSSPLGLFMKDVKWLKKLIYTSTGILLATMFHGLYNFALSISSENRYTSNMMYNEYYGDLSFPFMFLLLGLGIVGSYIGTRHLIKLYRKHN